MKILLLNIFCLLLSCSLLGAQIALSYGCSADIAIELSDLGEECPTEDTTDAEQELETEITTNNLLVNAREKLSKMPTLKAYLILKDRSDDIPFPPPDFS